MPGSRFAPRRRCVVAAGRAGQGKGQGTQPLSPAHEQRQREHRARLSTGSDPDASLVVLELDEGASCVTAAAGTVPVLMRLGPGVRVTERVGCMLVLGMDSSGDGPTPIHDAPLAKVCVL